jgi:putative transcription factor
MFSQDWEPVVFKKKKVDETKPKVVHGVRKVEQNREGFDHKTVPKDLADRIQKKRIELKLTQAQLAQKINEKPAVVNDIECCRGVYNHIHVNKVLKALNLTLKQM